MDREIIVSIEGGTLRYLRATDAPPLHLVSRARVVSVRASHVEPARAFKRFLFHALRSLFGRGRVYDWTREFRGPWRVRLANQHRPLRGEYDSRAAAVQAEVEYLNRYAL